MKSTKKILLSVIIPVYNEEQTIEKVIEKVRKVKIPGVKKEVIVVDDASTDRSREKILKQKGKLGIYMLEFLN